MSTTRRNIALLLVLAAVAAACGSTERGPELGIRRIALNLAFSEEELAEPVEPEVIIELIPAPPEVQAPADLAAFEVRPGSPPPPPPPPPPVLAMCPEAPADAAPREVVTATVGQPVEPGVYTYRNEGSISVVGGVLPLTFPFPPVSTWEVGEREQGEEGGLLGGGAGAPEWEVEKVITPTFTITERYRLDEEAILLVRRVITNGEVEQVLEPDPPVIFFQFGFEGDDWTSAGVDLETNSAIVRQGIIERREVVDLCGELVDTYRATIVEQVVNLATGEVSGTNDDGDNVINVATQYGGRVVREEVNSTTRTSDPESGAPVTVTFSYVSTGNGVEPDGGG